MIRNMSDILVQVKLKWGKTALIDLTEQIEITAELWEARANEARDEFIIFTEDWKWSRLLMINRKTLIHLSIHLSCLPQSAGFVHKATKPASI